jgi:branched-chain amino acid transport system permease protein
MTRNTLVRHAGVALAVGAVLVMASYVIDPYRDYQLATVAAYLCATAGLTVLIGLNGQLSLGHGALMAIGAYTVALLGNSLADRDLTGWWTLPVTLVAGVVTATISGAVIGVAAARLRGPYLAGATLAVAVAVPAIATVFPEVFNGDQGLGVYVKPPPEALGPFFPVEQWQAWIAMAGAALTMVALANLVRSRFGRTLRAVRDDEVAAQLAGVRVARTQVLAFVVSAACAGLGGGLLAVLAQSVSPSAFSLTLSLFLVLAIVLGGLGSLWGAVWGAVLLVILPEITHELTEALELSPAARTRLEGNLPLAIFGLTVVVVMIGAPGGLAGQFRRVARWTRSRWEYRRARRADVPVAGPPAPEPALTADRAGGASGADPHP